MLLTTICGLIVRERTHRLKHIQVISGMQLGPYWLANALVDFIKLEYNIGIALLVYYYAD